MATKTAPTKKADKPTTKPVAKPSPAKDMLARKFWEAVAAKHGKARYVGSREKFKNTLVEVLKVRTEPRHGYDCRVKFRDEVHMYVSPTSLVKA